ncbi:MAG TPA: hypothetical protein VI911_09420 [Patescibacteria group bacterium]|nr:MAG: hypothetical protein UR43_C0005G0134 [candidate division TM6 bacterium GW2011_GWF2_33_332]HLD91217.1 hypothetical protein [Patescibacteria group bacterium]
MEKFKIGDKFKYRDDIYFQIINIGVYDNGDPRYKLECYERQLISIDHCGDECLLVCKKIVNFPWENETCKEIKNECEHLWFETISPFSGIKWKDCSKCGMKWEDYQK